ncbi:hypothetical protein SAMN04488543_1968 [Friedmanniella luteola]|uniref:Uncharacterized protein n=1 Tax=Friedmanniella luteola TaxID=546871 RepID=A0A1H1T935_9ACTN|nr:hypothetical protein [Friedmanniella luteola]SDS56643.1 hypothetical protein SAMN04488543_1968 [Friedmanniella luteola]
MVRRAIFLLVAVLGGWWGLSLGDDATRIAQVSVPAEVGRDDPTVVVYTRTPEAAVSFEWILLADGKVSVSVDGFAPEGGVIEATVELTKGARLTFDDPEVRSRTDGDRQLVDLSAGDNAVGTPAATWRASANGRTEARVPDVWLGLGDDSAGLLQPSPESTAFVGVAGGPTESIDFFSPSTIQGGEVRVLETGSVFGGGSAVIWAVSPSKVPDDSSLFGPDQPSADLDTAVARLSEPAGVAGAQQRLLLSGAVLGLAAAALFEVFATGGPVLRRRRRGATSAAPTPAAVLPAAPSPAPAHSEPSPPARSTSPAPTAADQHRGSEQKTAGARKSTTTRTRTTTTKAPPGGAAAPARAAGGKAPSRRTRRPRDAGDTES